MILYDWHKIYKATNGKSVEIIRIINSMTYNVLPKNRKDPLYKYSGMNFVGESFLANPEALLQGRLRVTNKEVAQYIALAARRNLGAYLTMTEKRLSLFHINIDLSVINNNRLLYIKDNHIHFIFEEVTKGKSKNGSIV